MLEIDGEEEREREGGTIKKGKRGKRREKREERGRGKKKRRRIYAGGRDLR